MGKKEQTNKISSPAKQRGRPRKEIDEELFKKLCGIQCTLTEIAGVFDCSDDTIENWCKRTYGKIFSEVYKTASANGKISLRRTQFALAAKSPAMAIFLGKQYLGQRDMPIGEDGDDSFSVTIQRKEKQ